jgi:cellulose synthase/poly-beta-1,6-N-acetylglucosamine synthase-like glycosyltransferase
MGDPLISIVVPVRDGAAHIARCLESLLALDWPAERREIIVVDNASTDATAEIVRGLGVTPLREERRGAGIARNTGWRAARGELIAFTDCDCVASPRWLRLLVPTFEDAEVGGAGGRLVPSPPQSAVEEYIIAKDILSQERAMRDELLSPPFLVTANAMYRRAALEAVGGFDEWLTVNGEDADLAWRVQWGGWKLVYVPEAEVTHNHRSDVRGFMRQVRSYGAGTSYLFKKHRERFGFRRFTWRPPYWEILRGSALVPVRAITGKTRLERLAPVFDVLGGVSFLAGKIGTSIRLRVWNV